MTYAIKLYKMFSGQNYWIGLLQQAFITKIRFKLVHCPTSLECNLLPRVALALEDQLTQKVEYIKNEVKSQVESCEIISEMLLFLRHQ